MKVIVIDDSEIVLALTTVMLTDAGMTVVTLNSSLGAASIIGKEMPDLVLMDIDMPALSGETSAMILKRQRHLHAKIVLYSDRDPKELEAAVKRSGADGWVRKTADAALLVAGVKRAAGVA